MSNITLEKPNAVSASLLLFWKEKQQKGFDIYCLLWWLWWLLRKKMYNAYDHPAGHLLLFSCKF